MPFCSDFRKKTEYLCSVWFFLFGQFWPIEIIVFNKIFLYPIEDIDFLSSNAKRYIPLIIFVKSLGFQIFFSQKLFDMNKGIVGTFKTLP